MANHVYVITDEAISDDGKNSSITKIAVQSSEEAFDFIKTIAFSNKDPDTKWKIDFDNCEGHKINVIGHGLFMFCSNRGTIQKHGYRNILIEQIWLKESVRNESSMD